MSKKLTFTIHKKDARTKARTGVIETAHSIIETPVFMPVGTRGAVKTLTNAQLEDIDARIILGNTYHLMVRPGIDIIRKAQGLHAFMGWNRSILTDSGGFQVFSLSELNKITNDGVSFASHVDGAKLFLGPKESMQMQQALGSDIVMCFDQCPPLPSTEENIRIAVDRTILWAKTCRDYSLDSHQNLFGIVQGGTVAHLRQQCAEALVPMDFEGHAIGGLSVGETAEEMYKTIEHTEPYLPEHKPRYLMGVGTPRNIVEAVSRGIDMFDCVMPTRAARNGTAYTWQGKIQIKAGRYAEDFSPLDPELTSYASQFSKAYIRHLLNVEEITALTLVTIQNLAFYLDLMRQLRASIREGTFDQLYAKVCALYPQ